MTEVKKIIEQLDLVEHPEGGYYRETFRSKEIINRQNEERNAATGIYLLVAKGFCTSWHRVRSEELWHFYKGDKLVLEIINEEGKFNQLFLNDELSGEGQFQQLIPKNCWQRAYSTGKYTLVGCTVAPGFEFEDFEMIGQDKLADIYPEIRSDIVRNPFN
jgi:predicted cupin superfamily sugar epimerase